LSAACTSCGRGRADRAGVSSWPASRVDPRIAFALTSQGEWIVGNSFISTGESHAEAAADFAAFITLGGLLFAIAAVFDPSIVRLSESRN